MKTQIQMQFTRGSLWVTAFIASLTGAAGCLPQQGATGGDSGTIGADLVMGAIAFAADFARAMLAAFLL